MIKDVHRSGLTFELLAYVLSMSRFPFLTSPTQIRDVFQQQRDIHQHFYELSAVIVEPAIRLFCHPLMQIQLIICIYSMFTNVGNSVICTSILKVLLMGLLVNRVVVCLVWTEGDLENPSEITNFYWYCNEAFFFQVRTRSRSLRFRSNCLCSIVLRSCFWSATRTIFDSRKRRSCSNWLSELSPW